MAAITHSTEIARTPEEVFAYATDFAHFADSQVNVISVRLEGAAPAAVGTRAVVTRRAGPREVRGPEEIMDLNPPRSWTVRGRH